MFKESKHFTNRIRIQGVLRTVSPMHVGSGETEKLTDRLKLMKAENRDSARGKWISDQIANGGIPRWRWFMEGRAR